MFVMTGTVDNSFRSSIWPSFALRQLSPFLVPLFLFFVRCSGRAGGWQGYATPCLEMENPVCAKTCKHVVVNRVFSHFPFTFCSLPSQSGCTSSHALNYLQWAHTVCGCSRRFHHQATSTPHSQLIPRKHYELTSHWQVQVFSKTPCCFS